MSTLWVLIKRNVKIFFKDKGVLFPSLIAPLILLFLFITFLGNVYKESFWVSIPQGVEVNSRLVNGYVGSFLLSSLLAVCSVTVAFCANMQMVSDKVTGAACDISVSPCNQSVVALSYYIATELITAAICFVALGVGFIYLSAIGWYLSVAEAFLIILDVFLLTMFGTALSSVICRFLKSQGGIAAVSTIVSAAYGFICGAYMPVAQFSPVIQKVIAFLPGTYGTGLLRNHFMGGIYRELSELFPAEVITKMRDSMDSNLYFFANPVSIGAMFAVLGISVGVLVGIFVLIQVFAARRKNR